MSNEVKSRVDLLYNQLAAYLPMEKTELLDYLEEKYDDMMTQHKSEMVAKAEVFEIIEGLYEDAMELKAASPDTPIATIIPAVTEPMQIVSHNESGYYMEPEFVESNVYQTRRIPNKRRSGIDIIKVLAIVFFICIVILIFTSYMGEALDNMQQYVLAALIKGITMVSGLLVFALFFVLLGFIIWEIIMFIRRWLQR